MNRRVFIATLLTACSSGCLRLQEANAEETTGDVSDQTTPTGTITDRAPSSYPWEFRAKAPMSSAPVLLEDSVFVGSKDNSLYSLDDGTGELRWAHNAGGTIKTVQATDQTMVLTTMDGVDAVDAGDGKVLFELDNGAGPRRPLLTDEYIFTPGQDVLTAVERENWSTTWRFEAKSTFLARPAVTGDVLVTSDAGDVTSFPSEESTVYGLDVASGDLLWEIPVESDGLLSDVAIINRTAFIGGRYGMVAGIDINQGSITWRRTFEKSGNVPPQVATTEGKVILGFDSKMVTLSAETGETRWKTDAGQGRFRLIDGMIFTVTGTQIIGLDSASGELVYEQTIPLEISGGDSVPAVSDGAFYVTDRSYIRAFERENEVAR